MKRLALSAMAILLASSAHAGKMEHVVKPGETLGGIANRAGVSMRDIAEANGIKDPYPVRAGQTLIIPKGPRPAPASAASRATSHVVQPGETLNGIANRAGVAASAIAKANNIEAPYVIRAGQTLAIPSKGSATPSGSAQGNQTEHVVLPGETLGGIANRTGVPATLIAEANSLAKPYVIKVGQTLVLPRQRVHVVKPGDTGFGIAYRYGVPFSQIAVASGIAEDSVIKVGQKLVIPTITSPKAPSAVPTQTKSSTVQSKPTSSVVPLETGGPQFRWPLNGELLLGFQPRPGGEGHDGIDIAAQQGEAVRAAAGGIVIFSATEAERYGNLVIIYHDDGWHTAYGHLDTIYVEEGRKVAKGVVIGTAGTSGTASRPSLHFEIRKDNRPVDPWPRLGRAEAP